VANRKQDSRQTPLLEWIAAAAGVLLTLAMMGAMGWRAWQGHGNRPPDIEIRADEVVRARGGWIVTFTALNHSPSTAAAVEVEGTAGEETAHVTLDYVPGKSRQKGGLFFAEDPRGGGLQLRALGYSEP
jgi:uncharacterized protein (TIGR02588 family)